MPDEADGITVDVKGKSISVAPLRYAPSGAGLAIPYGVSHAEIKYVIAAGEAEAEAYLYANADILGEKLGVAVGEWVPFLRELKEMDRNGLGSSIKFGLSRIKGIRLTHKLYYGRRKRRKDYGPDPVQMLDECINEPMECFRSQYQGAGGEIDAKRFERAMISRFRSDTMKNRQPQYNENGCCWQEEYVDTAKVGQGQAEQMNRLYLEYRESRRRLFAFTPEAAWRELANAQKDRRNPMRRSMVPCFIDDMNYFLVELPYMYGFACVLKALHARCEAPTAEFNRKFFHFPRLDLDGLVPALHPFGELLARSAAFLRIAYAHFEDENSSEAAIRFYGSLMAAATVYKLRCQEERHADADAKRQGKLCDLPPEHR